MLKPQKLSLIQRILNLGYRCFEFGIDGSDEKFHIVKPIDQSAMHYSIHRETSLEMPKISGSKDKFQES